MTSRKSKGRRVLMILLAAFVIMAMTGHTLPAYAGTTNLEAAITQYGVSENNVLEASTPEEIKAKLTEAGKNATDDNMWIVHVNSGSYAFTTKLYVPKNVVLVAEDDSKFTATASFTQFFNVQGSLYGGNYDGKGKAYYCLRFEDNAFEGKNGKISHATCSNAQKAGIMAIGANTKNCVVTNCYVTKCGNTGISAAGGAHIKEVSNNTVIANEKSGVNLGLDSSIDIIKNNTINNNTGHGISTDSKDGKNPCTIIQVVGNKIQGNGVNGVFVDVNCKITKAFKSNKILNNKLNGLSISENANVKGIVKNTISGNKSSNLRVGGKKSVAAVGKNNTFQKDGNANISIQDGGKVVISGTKNTIQKAKGVGITVDGKSTLVIKGSGHKIISNGGFGIRVAGKSNVNIAGVTFGKNKTYGVRVEKGSKFKFKKTNLSKKATAKNRLYIEK